MEGMSTVGGEGGREGGRGLCYTKGKEGNTEVLISLRSRQSRCVVLSAPSPQAHSRTFSLFPGSLSLQVTSGQERGTPQRTARPQEFGSLTLRQTVSEDKERQFPK